MKLRFLLIALICFLAVSQKAHAQGSNSKQDVLDIYMTLVYGFAASPGDNFQSLRGELVKTSQNGTKLYAVKELNSKVVSRHFIMNTGGKDNFYMAVIDRSYVNQLLVYVNDWEKSDGAKMKSKITQEGGFYELFDAGGIVLNVDIPKSEEDDIILSAYPR